MTAVPIWVDVAAATDIDHDDVLEAIVGDQIIAVYRTARGYYATDGICSHEHSRLCEGFVFGTIIECGKHQGRFDVRTGAPKGAPAYLPLRTYPVRTVAGRIEVDVSAPAAAGPA